MATHTHPIAIIGAGPVGLAAAAHLVGRALPFVVLEAGAEIAASVRSWGHVQLFSPWRYVIDDAARTLLDASGWDAPDDEGYPTGADLVDHYLAPLAALPALASHIRTHTRVVAITRQARDKMKDRGRNGSPFVLHLRGADGHEERLLASAVIDASGTYTTANPAGADGLPALGEASVADKIFYGIPDALGAHRARYAGRRVLVLGSGHSAFNALLDLAQLADTRLTWAVRRAETGSLYGGGSEDGLVERGRLGERAKQLITSGGVTLELGFRAEQISSQADGMYVKSDSGSQIGPFDEIVVCTGFRPDLAMLRELRLGLDPSVEAPVALAPLIDPNIHSCGSVPPHGVDQLAHPETGFYIVGMKSYGRAPTFLLLTGYEQVRSVTAALAGDWQAARDVRLVLPETGVCSGPAANSCCAPATQSVNLIPVASSTLIPISVLPRAPQAASAGLTLVAAPVASTCCTPAVQETCCEPEAKADCCGSDGSSCGCGG